MGCPGNPGKLTAQANDEVMFEEADLEVGIFVEYESPRVIEILVSQPDYYDEGENSSSTIESSVYLGIEEARRFAAGLQLAIGAAEAELKRRATTKPRRKKWHPQEREVPTAASDVAERSGETTALNRTSDEKAKQREQAAAQKAARAAEKEAEKRRRTAKLAATKERKRAISETLAELGKPSPRRRK